MSRALEKQRVTATRSLLGSRHRFRWSRYTLVVLAVGLTLTGVAFVVSSAREYTKDAIQLERETRQLATSISAQFSFPVEALRATASLFSSSAEVTRTEFRAFTRAALETWPQIYCFEWMPLVTREERTAFEEQARQSGFPEFSITAKDSTGQTTIVAPDLNTYLPILYMEPLNEMVLGIDAGATEAARVSTGRRAWIERRITASPPYRLIEDPEGVHSLTCYAPAFALSGVPYEKLDDVRGEFLGLAAVIMRIEPTIALARESIHVDDLELTVLDTTDPNSPAIIYTSNETMESLALAHRELIETPQDPAGAAPVFWSQPLSFADRQWYVAARAVPGSGLAERGSTPWWVLLVGLALTSALTWGTGQLLATMKLRRQVDAALELGQYRLGRKLGEGGMGMVFEAEHRMLARPAAIKLVRPENLGAGPSGGSAILERFENEAKATARLRSPHTITIFDFGRTERGEFYYVMELLDGFDLESLVRRHGPLEPDRVVHFLRQACHSLAEAHAADLIHRDIKPANLYACRSGLDVDVVKVLDFGLVKELKSQSSTVTRENTILGTPAYMSPEAALGSLPLDGRTDLYALGCVGYWMLAGRPLFEGDTPMKVLLQHIDKPPPSLREHTEIAVPAALEQVLRRCLEKDREARPRNAQELDRLLAETGIEWDGEAARRWWETHYPARATGPVSSPTTVLTGSA